MEKKSEVEQCEQKQPPTIVREPKVHNDGKHIYLDFIATSRLAPTFAWKKGVGGGAKKIIASSDRIKILREFVSKKVYHFSLEIINPTIGDFGQYICTVRNKSGKLYATFNVEVPKKNFPSTEKPQIREDGKAPHFPRQPVTREYYDGSLALECFVDANPTPQVKWYYDNKEVENSARFRAYLSTTASDSYWAMLTIKKLVDADAGAYSCVIVNQHGKGIANFTVELTGFSSPTFVEKPQISSRDDGQVMVMEFRAKSILEPTFVWQKLVGGGAKEIISNSDRIKAVEKIEARNVYYSALKIKEPTKDKDAGQFICTVKNESGELTATFTVKFEVPEGAPSFTRKPQILQQTSSGGEPAICFDIGYSARMNPQVTWISPKSKKMKESSRIKFKTNDEGNGNFTAQLELTNYEAKNSGTYTCNIKNDAGEANVELTLNIEGPLDDYADDSEN